MSKTSLAQFETQLMSGILSCPIIYIEHYHTNFIDKVLLDITANDSGLSISNNSIIEFDLGRERIVDFKTKNIVPKYENKYRSVRTIITQIVSSDVTSKSTDKYEPIDPDSKIFLFKNLSKEFLDENVISLLKSFVSKYENAEYAQSTSIIITSSFPASNLPDEIKNFVTVIELNPPTLEEIRNVIVELVGDESGNTRKRHLIDELARTLQGLQLYEVKQTLKTALAILNNRLSQRTVSIALDEKKRIVKKSGIIEVIDTDVSFNDVGGLNKLREDLKNKSAIFQNLGDAIKYNVTLPKGILIIGMPGCGKSMIAQATANLFKVSLLRLDVSRLMGKYVGESEGNLRKALATAEAAHPCVLWIDEIEKAFAGANNSGGDNDMLIMRMMGHFLTWMQERKTPVYIVATANDVMRPEFMRKGRFDEVYFVDFPTKKERTDILRKKIEKRFGDGNDLFDFSEVINNLDKIVSPMEGELGGFSGSEIECVLNMVAEEKFCEYLKQKEASTLGDAFVPKNLKVTKSDFEKSITKIKRSVLANQTSKKKDKSGKLNVSYDYALSGTQMMTSIERIKAMQETYNFTNAADGSDVK